jgi:hypothetical protein
MGKMVSDGVCGLAPKFTTETKGDLLITHLKDQGKISK